MAAQAYNRRGEGHMVRCAEFARKRELTVSNLDQNFCYGLPKDLKNTAERQYALHAVTRPDWYEAEESQSVNYFSGDEELSVSQQQERDARRTFGDMPVVVLSRETWNPLPWPAPSADTQACKDEWRSGQAAIAARSARGSFQVVPRSGHFIQADRPEVVIDAVRKVIAMARSGA
jgi:pimeloyl-ACP methyl ester carboxylesterase